MTPNYKSVLSNQVKYESVFLEWPEMLRKSFLTLKPLSILIKL